MAPFGDDTYFFAYLGTATYRVSFEVGLSVSPSTVGQDTLCMRFEFDLAELYLVKKIAPSVSESDIRVACMKEASEGSPISNILLGLDKFARSLRLRISIFLEFFLTLLLLLLDAGF